MNDMRQTLSLRFGSALSINFKNNQPNTNQKTKDMKKNNYTTNETPNTSAYKSHYNESAFWRVVKKVGAKVAYPALLLIYELKSPDVPLKAKAEIIGALGYLICPVDLIPDNIPVLGYTDDFAALRAAVRLTLAYITPEIEAAAQAKLREWFGEVALEMVAVY